MLLRRLAISLSLLCAALPVLATAQNPPFIKIHEGRHWIWWAREDQYNKQKADIEALFDYADKAFDKLSEFWGMKPKQPKYFLLVMDKPGGGFAAGNIGEISGVTKQQSPGIGASYDAFSGTANGIKAFWAHILITHEMVNMFTGQIVSGGWPTDWWADHRSPFPLMTAVQIEYALVPEMAIWHEKQGRGDPMVVMFEKLLGQYGWSMFRKSFKTAIADGVNWDAFGENPSPLRTAYVAAYLQIGAPEDISEILATQVPDFNARTMSDIVKAHAKWAALPAGSAKRKSLQQAFLKGDYKSVLE